MRPRTARRLALLLACTSLACKDDPDPAGSEPWQSAEWPAPLEDGSVVRFTLDAPGRLEESLHIDREGELRYRLAQRPHAIDIERTVPGRELEEIRDRLRANACCEMTSEPVDDEDPRARLQVRLPELSCDITLHVHTWDDLEQPRACEAVVRSTHGRPRGRLQ